MAISAQHTRFETNEYISALPAEDLIKVATKKQEMYDEGRFKIKQTIDNYGKLRNSMVSDVHKNYLDQEINKLTKNIQNNAGLDFANIGNVEAVLNLAKPFENDQYIRIGLNNGIVAQQRFAELNALPKESRNVDNDALFLKDYNQMLESGGLDTKLNPNKKYEEYVDIKKELAAIEKEVKGKMETVYAEGPRGYFEKTEIERKTAQEVYERAMLSLSPAQQRQLQIHAEAEMDKLGPNAVYQVYVGHLKQEKLTASQTLKSANIEIARIENLKVKTAADKATLKEVYRIKEDTQSTLNAVDQSMQMNPDEFNMQEYVPLFSKRFISGFAQGFAYETKKTDLKEDKVFLSQMGHQQALSTIAAQARETRTTAQFTNDLQNFQVSSGVGLSSLQNIGKYLGGAKIDANSPPADQVKAMIDIINNLPTTGQGAITERQRNVYLEELRQLGLFYADLETANPNDKVAIDRSKGLGQVQTSVGDMLRRPVTDIVRSGNTVEFLRNTVKVSASKAAALTPEQKADAKYNQIVADIKRVNPNITQVELDKKVKAKMDKEPADVSVTYNVTPDQKN